MNTIIIMGRLTRDPEIRYSKDSKAIARVSIAVDRRFKQEGQPEADFFNLVGFGKTADFIEKYFHKGMKALVAGELRNNNYTGKDGTKYYTDDIIISSIEFAESKKADNLTPVDDNSDNPFIVNIPEGIDEELPFN